MSIEVVYEGMKLEEVSNFYKKKALLNVFEFYQIVLDPLINELQSEELFLRLYIEDSFEIDKIEFFEDSENLNKTWLSLLKPFFRNEATINQLKEIPVRVLLINSLYKDSKKVV
jgi:hypothetical protein